MNASVGMPALYQDTMYDNQLLNTQLVTLQTQASTGKKFANVSDDPSAAMQVIASTDQNQLITTHLNNIQSATTALNTSNSALQQIDNIFTQAKSIAIQASNSTNDTSSFSAMAQQVNGLINSLLTAANTQNNGAYVFAGAATSTQPFVVTSQDGQGDPTAVSYQGSSDATSTIVDTNQSVPVYYAGSNVFQAGNTGAQGGSGAADAFQALIGLRDDLNNVNNLSSTAQIQAISGRITDLDNVSTQIETAMGAQSTTLQGLSSLQSNLQNLQLSTQETISNVGDTNMTDVVVQLQAYEQQLQLSLEAFAKLSSTSLLNYLQ